MNSRTFAKKELFLLMIEARKARMRALRYDAPLGMEAHQ
jgi:hypothetical protein